MSLDKKDKIKSNTIKSFEIELDMNITPELEAEGYARESMRRIQQGRKVSGLVKNDRIDLTLVVSPEMKEMLTRWEKQIQEKVGADTIAFVEKTLGKTLYSKEEKVKDELFTISFNQVK